MNAKQRILFLAPRILGILFAIFISLFALDVFNEGYGVWDTILALLIHLVPTYLIIITLLVAWRWESIGAGLFFALAVFYLVISRGQGWILAGPCSLSVFFS